jgi:hypothetical protein
MNVFKLLAYLFIGILAVKALLALLHSILPLLVIIGAYTLYSEHQRNRRK